MAVRQISGLSQQEFKTRDVPNRSARAEERSRNDEAAVRRASRENNVGETRSYGPRRRGRTADAPEPTPATPSTDSPAAPSSSAATTPSATSSTPVSAQASPTATAATGKRRERVQLEIAREAGFSVETPKTPEPENKPIETSKPSEKQFVQQDLLSNGAGSASFKFSS